MTRGGHDLFDLEGLRDEVPRAFARSLDGRVERAEAGDEDDGAGVAQLTQNVEAALRRFEVDVADDEVEAAARGERERLLGRERALGLPPLRRENLTQQLARSSVVVNYEDAFHKSLSF